MNVPIKVMGHTIVGVNTSSYPVFRGNCFDLLVRGKTRRVVNFAYENLREAQSRFGLNDIEVEYVPKSNDHRIIITDDRIPKDWYPKDWCSVCCPAREMPFEMRKRYFANMRAMGAKWKKTKDGYVIMSYTPGARQLPSGLFVPTQ